jgi:hypothetical protein
MEATFSTFATCESLNIDYQRFRQWTRKGDIKLSEEATGHGTKAKVSRYDAYRIEKYRQLIESGYRRNVAKIFVEKLEDDEIKANDFVLYAIELEEDGPRVYPRFFKDKKSAIEHLHTYTFTDVSLFDLGNLKSKVDSALAKTG